MAIFYLDYENGNDANDGSTWALAWKTITSGATAARIAPGDTIRIAKSPDPTSLGQTASWTNLSRAVTLTTAVTKNVYLDGAWTASANVTCTASTTRKEGANSASIAIAAGFTTGKAAYYALGSAQDFSGYQQLSFWIRTSVALATADTLRICLCSDAAGDTIVDSFSVPGVPVANRWQVVTVDLAAALGASIQSVALYCQTDPGAPTILLDNIIACKAKGSADSLTLSSLIGKNTGTEGWFCIKSINGAEIDIDDDTNTAAGSGRGYYGATETVTTYKRETIKTPATTQVGVVQEIQDSGTDGSSIAFDGGYNTTTSLVDGMTIFDGQNSNGYGLKIQFKNYLNITLSFCRYDTGIEIVGASTGSVITTWNIAGCGTCGMSLGNGGGFFVVATNINNNLYGIRTGSGNANTTLNAVNLNSNSASGIYVNGCRRWPLGFIGSASNNGLSGVLLTGSDGIPLSISAANSNAQYGVSLELISFNNFIALGASSGNVSGSIRNTVYTNYLINSVLDSTTKATVGGNFGNGFLWSTNENGDTDTHFGYTDGGLIASETSIRHTASGIAWRLSPTSTNRSSTYPLPLKIATVACAASTAVTVSAWFRRSNTGLTARLVCRGSQLTGVTETSSSMTAAADTWEQLSVTVTPAQKGVLEFHAEVWGGTTYSNYVDDVTIA